MTGNIPEPAFIGLAQAVVSRAVRDLLTPATQAEAQAWLCGDAARAWVILGGYDYERLLQLIGGFLGWPDNECRR